MIHIRRRRADRRATASAPSPAASAAGPVAAGSCCRFAPAIRTPGLLRTPGRARFLLLFGEHNAGRRNPVPAAAPRCQKYRPVRYKVTMPANSADLSGRTFLVTGANTGIGRATAGDLASRGGKVFVACRSAEKGRATAAGITAATGNDA